MTTAATEQVATDSDPVALEGAQLQHTIASHLDGIVEIAHRAVTAADSNLVAAVTGVRRALRRARAIADLVRGELPRKERRAIRGELKAARKALDTASHGVAASALSQLPLDETERDSARAVVDAAAAPSKDDVKLALAAGLDVVVAQVGALKAALPATLEWSQLVDGARSIYRNARRERRTAIHKRNFRVWRRRTAELAYQIDVLAGFAGAQVGELGREIRETGDAQRPVAELIVARELVRSQRELLDREAGDRLVAAIDALLDPMIRAARKTGREAFRRRPREFGRMLNKARHPSQPD